MNDNEFDPVLEAEVRAELRRTMAVPEAPMDLRERVERMAEEQTEADGRRRSFRPWIGRGVIIGRLAATAVVVVLVAATVVLLTGGGNKGTSPGAASTQPSPVNTDIAARSGDPAGTPGPTYQPDPREVRLQGPATDGTAVVVVGGKAIRVSTDGGDTWSAARPLPADTVMGGRVSFVDAKHGWSVASTATASTNSLVMYRTTDGGQTWQSSQVGSRTVKPGTWAADFDFHFVDVDHGYLRAFQANDPAIDPTPYSDCVQFTTDDGGVTWSAPASVSCGENEATWVTNTLGYASGQGTTPMEFTVTQDGGRTWTTGELPIDASEMGSGVELLVAEPGRLRVDVGFAPKTGPDPRQRHAAYDSTDGGATWSKAYDHDAGEDIQVLAASTFDHWFARTNAHGDSSSLIASDDGGRTWHEVASSFVPSMGPMRWWDSRRGIVQGFTCPNGGTSGSCSNHSTVYITSDGGYTWHQVPF
jgi:photosystem II stability/assembly factor-like uncharacterized protein